MYEINNANTAHFGGKFANTKHDLGETKDLLVNYIFKTIIDGEC